MKTEVWNQVYVERTFYPLLMTTAGIARLVRAVERGEPDAVQRFFARSGWGSAVREVRGQVGRSHLLELSWGDEPQALVVLGPSGDDARTASWGYSREAPYALSWSPSRLSLLDSRYWREAPGDAPLLDADAADLWSVGDLLSFLRPEQLLDDVPGGYGEPESRQRELHETLAGALGKLRMQVARAGLLEDADPEDRDASVLRLFHQILFIRFQEDRGHPASEVLLREAVEGDDVRGAVATALDDYRRNLNSELFAPAEIDISTLPAEPLADVLSMLVEPWKRLRLNFSLSRSEIAGRLYQTYLASLPARRPSGPQSAFFDDAHAVDAQATTASYYTPPGLARLVVERTLVPWLERVRPSEPAGVRVVDPACGSGAFLIAAYRVLADYFAGLKGAALTPAERSELLIESIFGADVDERAIELARVQLLEEADVRGRLPVLGENLHRGDSLLAPPGESAPKGAVDWSAACRDGRPFDVVLTNPPFRAGYKIRSVAQEDVAKRLAALYPSTYGAHADYSHLFVDLAFRLLGPEGVAGFVLPVGIEGNSSAASVRRLLAERGLRSVVDFRGGQLFDASTYVCTVSTGPSRNAELLRAEFPNSDGRALLEDSVRSRPELMRRQRVSRRTLVREAERGWDPFRLEWELDLRGEVEAELAPLAPEESAQRAVRYGTKPGKQKAFTVAEGEWRKGRAGAIAVGDREIPAKYLPPLVKGGQLSPFHIARSGDRLFVPFETDGSLSGHPSVVAELERRGGLPKHPQHGDLAVLRGPKLLVRTLSREATTVADPDGEAMPLMGEAGAIAIRLGDAADGDLFAYEALLNSSLIQWWLAGMGRPRRGGWFGLNVSLVRALPVPALSAGDMRALRGMALAIREKLGEERALLRRAEYRRGRAELDSFVLDLVGASERLRSVVAKEVRRAL